MTAPRVGPERAWITHLGRMGDGAVVRDGVEPVYVRGALPGEEVRLGPAVRERKILRAPLLEVLAPSPDRCEPACSVVERCGGCPLAHLARAAQLEVKRGWALEALRAQGIAPDTIDVETAMPEPGAHYRMRARLAWQRGRGGARIGYRVAQGVAVVEPARCEVLVPALEEARARVMQALAPHLAGEGELRLAISGAAGERHLAGPEARGAVLRIESADPQPATLFRALEALVREGALRGARALVGGATVPTDAGDPVERSPDVDGRWLEAEAGGFRQAHLAAAAELGGRVLAWSRPERQDVLELYAGHGHFSLALAARARSLIAVELDAPTVRALGANARAHGITLDARLADAAEALTTLRGRGARPSVIVLDPPRAGAGPAVAGIVALRPERVVYVACDVATFARDAARLGAAGLGLRRLAVLDLFPDTLHVEVVGLFERSVPASG